MTLSDPRQVARQAVMHLRRGSRLGAKRLSGLSRRPLMGPVEVVDSFDAWAYLKQLHEQISRVLASRGIRHLVLDARVRTHPTIVAAHEDAQAIVAALAEDEGTQQYWVAKSSYGFVGRSRPLNRRPSIGAHTHGLLVARHLVASNAQRLTNSEMGVLIDLWHRVGADHQRPDGGTYPEGSLVAPIRSGWLDNIDPDSFAAAQENNFRLPAGPPSVLQVVEPIDLVYTWVDGSDPAWKTRKNEVLGITSSGLSSDAAITARFESHDELRYSLRSVQMYANWVRKIWIVTDRQVPAWLRTDERLNVIDHSEIFADPAALPVFNSHAIESQLHHIPGLSELYLYLNDDFFFGSPVRPETFFHGNGVLKFFTSPALIDIGESSDRDLAVLSAAKNNRALIEREFGRIIGNKLRHTPQPQSRAVMTEMETRFPDLFDSVMRSRFRSHADYALPSSLSAYYAYARGKAVTGRIHYGYLDLASPDAEMAMEGWLYRRNLECFCVNDSRDPSPGPGDPVNAKLDEFLEHYFPVKSVWET